MSTPLKSWSRVTQEKDAQLNTSRVLGTQGRNMLNSNAPPLPSQPVGNRPAIIPPLPPRPPQLITIARPTYGMPPSMYGSYSGYGGYSSYGNYPGNMYMSGGGYGYGSYGQPINFENRFLQVAEERSRSAFQSIESLVRAFSSVSMMLESTFHAMHSSFRAVLGVADNFSRLRQMFAQFFSAITVLRIIQNFYRRLLHWLGVIDHIPQSEQVWNSAASGNTTGQAAATYSSWPLFTFIGLLFGGPYLISKFLSSNIIEPNKWDPKKGTICKAIYAHQAASQAELTFNENEFLNVAPTELQLEQNNGWVLACNSQGKIGYVPINRLAFTQGQGQQYIRNFNVNNPMSSDTSVQPQG